MSIRVLCPEGHPVCIAAAKLSDVVFCPQCYTSFHADLADPATRQARNAGSKRARDEDEDDEDTDKPVQKKKLMKADEGKPQKKKKREADDEVEDEKPHNKPTKAKKKKEDDEDDDDDDDDEDGDEDDEEDEKQDEDETIDWTKKKRQLAIVNTGLMAYLISYYIITLVYGIMVLCALGWLVCLVFAHFVYAPGPNGNSDMSLPDLFIWIICILVAIGTVPLYLCQIVGWITGLFSPSKAEGRPVCIAAILLVLGPILLYIIYAIFRYGIIERMEVSAKMLNMFHGFAFTSVMMALYAGLIYLGRIAGFMGLSMEKHKPAALGWFIVGGSILMAGCIVVTMIRPEDPTRPPIVPWWSLYIIGGFMYAIHYFVITAMRDLIQMVDKVRAAIDDYIKYG